MPTTPLYAALLALLFVALSVRTLRLRYKYRVALGDGGNPELFRATRAHANFAEYVPLALLLIYLAETQGAHIAMVHALGIGLLVGRLSHGFGVSQPTENLKFRSFGMVLTFTALVIPTAYLVYRYAMHLGG